MDKETEKDVYEVIEMDDQRFDRAYTLEELLPESQAASFLKGLNALGMDFIGIVYPNGVFYFSTDNLRAESLSRYLSALDSTKAHDDSDLICIQEMTLAMPLVHQFEILGFLVVEYSDETGYNRIQQDALIGLISKMLGQTMMGNYKNLMASGLHNQVVKESYDEIRHKNELLEKSEKRYRLLAESLEQEVLRKSEEVKDVHTQLMHQEKLASIGHLAAGVAHEINNPMGFISSNLRTLKEYTTNLAKAFSIYRRLCETFDGMSLSMDVDPDFIERCQAGKDEISHLDIDFLLEDIPHLLEESMEGAERINKIVSDLKDFAHPGEENAATADLIECIESTLRIVWNELKYKANVIRSYQKIPRITCFPRQLNQVIMNLLVNAAQAIEKNGEIEITTRDLGDRVELTVRDTGHGIPEDIQARIFDPFFTTKDVGKGTGLGLNLVYNIVKKHKGQIHVKSTVEKGATFIITLPVDADL